ncbi:DUF1206 domain-containing protein [Isoptericola sp. b490]|uniref:DUF1206 domain-containing protein n=1 Tax=Actinotalea lenta TaxID=3064654 RepID=UPI002713EA73|nr:DUF1206 domain-containing protein [Isoptericola sp. b490]MDO8121033.1 DUF1206 domain-containing protein [Isoptericola sp. b490]
MPRSARAAARRVNDSAVLEIGARVGLGASGLVHLILAWLALQLAFGSGGQNADQTGALRQLAGTTLGQGLLWIAAGGFALLAVWQVTEALVRRGKDRLPPAARALVHAALAFVSLSVLLGSSGGGSQQARSLSARLMDRTVGVVAVGAVGLVILAVGAVQVWRAAQGSFRKQLRPDPPPWVVQLARIGLATRGLAIAAIGGLFLLAAVQHDPQKTGGLDTALHSLLGLPAGQVVVAAIAAGMACYGGYALARMRYGEF